MVNFSIQLEKGDQEVELNSFEEGVEFAYRFHNKTEWIPLGFYTSSVSKNELHIGEINKMSRTIQIRGYSVPYGVSYTHDVRLKMCAGMISSSDWANSCLQFRWLQTVRQKNKDMVDLVTLDNVSISLRYSQQQKVTLLEDKFTDQLK